MALFGLLPEEEAEAPYVDPSLGRIQNSDTRVIHGNPENWKDNPNAEILETNKQGDLATIRYNQERYSASRAPQYEQLGADAASQSQQYGQDAYERQLALGDDLRSQGSFGEYAGRVYQDNMGLRGATAAARGQDLQNSFLGQAGQAGQAYGQGLGYAAGSRDAAMHGVGQLRDFYQQGPGPSAAEAQLADATQRNMANALALSQSGRGGPSAAAQRQAMFQNAATQQQAARDLSLLRAQEADAWRGRQLQAMGAEQQALSGIRGQDLGMAGLGAGTQTSLAGLGLQAGQSGIENQLAFSGLGLSGLGQGQQYNLGMQGMGQQANQQAFMSGMMGNQQAYGQQMSGMQAGDAIRQQDVANNMNVEALRTGNQMQANLYNAQAANQATQGDIGMAGMGIAALAMMSDVRAKRDIVPASGDTADNFLPVGSGYRSLSDADRKKLDEQERAAMQTGGKKDTAMQAQAKGVSESAMDRLDRFNRTQETYRDIRSGYDTGPIRTANVPQMRYQGPLEGGMGNMMIPGVQQQMMPGQVSQFGSMMSDVRNKDKVRPADIQIGEAQIERPAPRVEIGEAQIEEIGGQPVRTVTVGPAQIEGRGETASIGSRGGEGAEMLRQAPGYSYNYKGDLDDGERHYGPMAQDLERTPMGRSAVFTGPDGMKRIDTQKLTLANTAAASDLQKQLDDLRLKLNVPQSPRYV